MKKALFAIVALALAGSSFAATTPVVKDPPVLFTAASQASPGTDPPVLFAPIDPPVVKDPPVLVTAIDPPVVKDPPVLFMGIDPPFAA